MQSKSHTIKLLEILKNHYGEVETFLHHKNEFEFLIAVILSAQTTDVMVNKVTPLLFAKYPTAAKMKKAKLSEILKLIHNVNYRNNKAKFLIETARIYDEEFGNKMPDTMEELLKFPGVGRKVANVILGDHFEKIAGIVVDTHIRRVSFRIGWTNSINPEVIEKDLMQSWPEKYWVHTPKRLILIGREYCFPGNPNCKDCPLNTYCEKRILRQSKVQKEK